MPQALALACRAFRAGAIMRLSRKAKKQSQSAAKAALPLKRPQSHDLTERKLGSLPGMAFSISLADMP